MTRPARLFVAGMVAATLVGVSATAFQTASPSPSEAEVRAALTRPAPAELPQLTVAELFDRLYDTHKLVVRVDAAEFRRLAPQLDPDAFAAVVLPARKCRGLSVADVLEDVAAKLYRPDQDGSAGGAVTFRVRGGQVRLTPAYLPPNVPGGGYKLDFIARCGQDTLAEYRHGPAVSAALDGPLSQVVKQLRDLTGANVVLDPRAAEAAKARVAGTFDDVRLLTVLRVISGQAGLAVVTLDNLFYLTDPATAGPLQRLSDIDTLGFYATAEARKAERPLPVPAGWVTDGYQFYFRPADLKPVPADIVSPPPVLVGCGVVQGVMPAAPRPLPGFQPVPAPPGQPGTPPPAGKS